MDPSLLPYRPALFAAALVAALFMLQTLVGFISRRRARHPGGVPVEGGHDVWLWRVDRARANTVEVIGNFALLLGLGVLLRASPSGVAVGAVVFAASRLLHMGFYYANWQRPRSVAFGFTNVGMIVLLVQVLRAAAGAVSA